MANYIEKLSIFRPTKREGRLLCVRHPVRRLRAMVLVIAVFVASAPSLAAEGQGDEPPSHRHFIGTSASVLMNFFPNPPIRYFQLDYGYRFTRKDAFIVELIAMGYSSPMGNPGFSGPSYLGSVWSQGVSLAYQRFIWRRFFGTVHVTPQWTRYSDEDGDLLQRGFLLWFQARVGYQFNINTRHTSFYLEPSIEFNYWPLNWNVPNSFSELDAEYPNFLIAPGLNLGVLF